MNTPAPGMRRAGMGVDTGLARVPGDRLDLGRGVAVGVDVAVAVGVEVGLAVELGFARA